MARTKKVVEETIEVKEAEVVQETKETKPKKDKTKELEEELAKKDAENKAMQEQLAQLQQMMLQMQSNQNAILASNMGATSISTRDEKVKIQSHIYGKNTIANNDGSGMLTFKDSGEVATVSNKVLDSMMKPQTKELFRKGLLSFVGESEKYYDEYDITKPMILNDENIKDILQLPKAQCIAKLDEVTNRKTDSQLVVCLFWSAIRLLAKDEIRDSSVKYTLAEYFNCPQIDNRIEMVHYAKESNFIK